MARTGKEFLQGLKDDRQIWVGSERVRDVAAHPAFAGAARSVAALFDLQHEAADACLMPDQRRQARTLRTRFRHDPAAYLAELEQKACQLTLPA